MNAHRRPLGALCLWLLAASSTALAQSPRNFTLEGRLADPGVAAARSLTDWGRRAVGSSSCPCRGAEFRRERLDAQRTLAAIAREQAVEQWLSGGELAELRRDLARALDAAAPAEQPALIEALGMVGDRTSIHPLARTARRHAAVAADCLLAIGAVGDPHAAETLARFVTDESLPLEARLAALAAVEMIGGDAARRTLDRLAGRPSVRLLRDDLAAAQQRLAAP